MGQVKGTDDAANGEEWAKDKQRRGGRATCGERRGASRRAVRLVTHPNHHDGLLDNVRYTDLRCLRLPLEPIQSIGQPLPINFQFLLLARKKTGMTKKRVSDCDAWGAGAGTETWKKIVRVDADSGKAASTG